mmetsp:Transcript_6222/g.26451  ORF Transcript_6222/g.26451 Transcript_6222/m.26451 type:complete len:215 (+) Transcript_6222:974-1618(+)
MSAEMSKTRALPVVDNRAFVASLSSRTAVLSRCPQPHPERGGFFAKLFQHLPLLLGHGLDHLGRELAGEVRRRVARGAARIDGAQVLGPLAPEFQPLLARGLRLEVPAELLARVPVPEHAHGRRQTHAVRAQDLPVQRQDLLQAGGGARRRSRHGVFSDTRTFFDANVAVRVSRRSSTRASSPTRPSRIPPSRSRVEGSAEEKDPPKVSIESES